MTEQKREGPERSYWLPRRGVIVRHNETFDRHAVFSECLCYRYDLFYKLGDTGPVVVFIMLNPSTANELDPDPTVTRCMGFARSLGASALRVSNIFALRSTDPLELVKSDVLPVGPLNDQYITDITEDEFVICAWGEPSNARLKRLVRERSACVVELLGDRKLHALKLTKSGVPRHPLYLRGDSQPVEWAP